MKRKPRNYSDLFEPKKVEQEHITMNELLGLSLEEMMLRANGAKKDKDVKIQTGKDKDRV